MPETDEYSEARKRLLADMLEALEVVAGMHCGYAIAAIHHAEEVERGEELPFG